MLDYMSLKWKLFKAKFFGEENGAVDLIVIVVLIAIVVVLAIVFRDKIGALIDKIFGGVEENLEDINSVPSSSTGTGP